MGRLVQVTFSSSSVNPYQPCMAYFPSSRVEFYGFHVGKYTVPPMDAMGNKEGSNSRSVKEAPFWIGRIWSSTLVFRGTCAVRSRCYMGQARQCHWFFFGQITLCSNNWKPTGFHQVFGRRETCQIIRHQITNLDVFLVKFQCFSDMFFSHKGFGSLAKSETVDFSTIHPLFFFIWI